MDKQQLQGIARDVFDKLEDKLDTNRSDFFLLAQVVANTIWRKVDGEYAAMNRKIKKQEKLIGKLNNRIAVLSNEKEKYK